MAIDQRLDYYNVLGLDKNAAQTEIKQAYRFLSAQLHPDKHSGQNAKIAAAKMKELNEAYEALKNKNVVKRAKHDELERPENNPLDARWSFEADGYRHAVKRVTKEQWERAVRAKEMTDGCVILDYLDSAHIEKKQCPVKGRYFEIDTVTPNTAAAAKEFSILGVNYQDIYTYGNLETGEMSLTFYREDLSAAGAISLKNNWKEYTRKYGELVKLTGGGK